MSLPLGARAVLAFLLQKGAGTSRGCWWRQKRISEETGIPLRSVQRYLAKLEQAGRIRVQHRQSTTNLYFAQTVEISVEKDQSGFSFSPKVAGPPRQNGGSFYRTEVSPPEVKQRNAAKVQTQNLTPEISAVLHRARKRIERARNPAAYRATIIGIELRLAKERSRNTSSYFSTSNEGAKPEVAPRCRSGDPAKKPPEPEWNIRGPSDSGFEGSIADLARRKRLG